jgi:hypothetical protein
MFERIFLEPEQKDLLIQIVEASRNVSRSERMKFLVIESEEGDILIHPGLPGGKTSIYAGDVEILANTGLINRSYGSKGSPRFDVHPIGFKFYSHLKESSGEPIERVENSFKSYINSEPFITKHKHAFDKWSMAQDHLWAADNQDQFTTIGHLCRESMQEFVDILLREICPHVEHRDKSKIVARLKIVITEKKKALPKTIFPLLEALISYWGCVVDIVQRQEHGGNKEGKELVWEDARRVVFSTMVVMHEIDNALNNL